MVQSGFTVFVTLLLTLFCWLGTAASGSAHSLSTASLSTASLSTAPSSVTVLSTAPTIEIAMGSKPLFSFSGKQPTNLGIKDGKFAPCPNTPNCVSSQAADGDAEHKIAPIAYQSAASDIIPKLKSLIEGMERTQVVTASSDYLYAQFTTALMGFVDDVEFYLDPSTPGQLQVRSASRLGQSDLGVNRKRVEEIRSKLTALEG